jgi:serine/threonine-protein kinase
MDMLIERAVEIRAPIQILGVLQKGSQGIVYKARLGRLGRLVALKVLHEEAVGVPPLVERFLTEAEAAARLGEHPNIVYVLHVGEWQGRPCIVMHYIDGGTLAARTGGEARPVDWSVWLVETLALAMHYAHERGVIHRDLKPSNVLFTADGTPKIADWGIAKLLDQDRTQLGVILGSRGYLAPEQETGRSREADCRTDVYALGVILYECLTGRRPTTRSPRPAGLQCSLSGSDLVPPSWLRPEVPAALDAVCRRCLAQDPNERFQTAQALAEALRPFRDRQQGR